MSGIHFLDEDLTEFEVDVAHEMGGWIGVGMSRLEAYLDLHRRFAEYCEADDGQ